MTETIRQAKCIVDDFTKPATVKAIITVVLTIVLGYMVATHIEVPEWFKLAWFTMIGVYMELPNPFKNTEKKATN